jgi:hypothetical protein
MPQPLKLLLQRCNELNKRDDMVPPAAAPTFSSHCSFSGPTVLPPQLRMFLQATPTSVPRRLPRSSPAAPDTWAASPGT